MTIARRPAPPLGAPIGFTFCSGIGAPEVAAPFIDWRLASEIEAFPRAVLQERLGYALPEDHNQGAPLLWSDMTEITPELMRAHGQPLPDVIVAGTPCQAFSGAGLRKGVADPRGNLTLKFVETCHDFVAARPDGKLAVVWENVPGVLSDTDNAFGCFLGGIVGADDPLSPPRGESWPGAGMVSGPRSRIAWRVCDAQYFGVAQRRRRVFVVVDFGGSCDPAAVLFEPKSLRGHPAPRRGAREGSPGGTGPGARGGRDGMIPDLANPLTARMHKGINTTADEGQTAIPVAFQGTGNGEGNAQDQSPSLRASAPVAIAHPPADRPGAPDHQVTHALRGEGFDASEDGTGRGTPIIPVGVEGVAIRGREGGGTAELTGPIATALRASQGGGDKPHVIAPVAFAQNQRDEVRTLDKAGALAAEPGAKQQTYLATTYAVRRLMPIECERLQGFPDGWTEIAWRGRAPEACPDGPRYKALGNSMAVPNMAWILERLAVSAGWPLPEPPAEITACQ